MSSATEPTPSLPSGSAGVPAPSGRRGIRIARQVLAAVLIILILTTAPVPAATPEVRRAAIWVLWASAAWAVLRLLLFGWKLLRLLWTRGEYEGPPSHL